MYDYIPFGLERQVQSMQNSTVRTTHARICSQPFWHIVERSFVQEAPKRRAAEVFDDSNSTRQQGM